VDEWKRRRGRAPTPVLSGQTNDSERRYALNGQRASGEHRPRTTHRWRGVTLYQAAEILAGHDTRGASYTYRGLKLSLHSDGSGLWEVYTASGGDLIDALHTPGFSSAEEFLERPDALADDHADGDDGGETGVNV